MNPQAQIEEIANKVSAKFNKLQAENDEINSGLREALELQKKVNSSVSAQRQVTDELGARLQAIEQHVVKMDIGGGGDSYSYSGAAVAATAMQEFDSDPAFMHLRAGNHGSARASVTAGIKAALTNDQGTSNGGMPSQPERRGVIGQVFAPLNLLQALPSRPVAADSVEFIQLNSDDSAGVQELEGDEKKNLDFEGTLVKAHIATIAGHTTASRQVLADHAALQGQIDRTLRGKVLAKLEDQLINGTGADGSILGLVAQSTAFLPSLNVQAPNALDLVGEAIAAMRGNGYSPSIVVVNPLDWFGMTVTKTTDNDYLVGSPVMPAAPALWGVTVVQSSALPQGDALVIDPAFVTVLDRQKADVMISTSHKDYFTRNLCLILSECRAGLEVLDGFAVYQVSLVPASGL